MESGVDKSQIVQCARKLHMIDFGFMALNLCFLQGKLSLRHGIRLPEWVSLCDDYRGLGVWAAEPLAAAAVTCK